MSRKSPKRKEFKQLIKFMNPRDAIFNKRNLQTFNHTVHARKIEEKSSGKIYGTYWNSTVHTQWEPCNLIVIYTGGLLSYLAQTRQTIDRTVLNVPISIFAIMVAGILGSFIFQRYSIFQITLLFSFAVSQVV